MLLAGDVGGTKTLLGLFERAPRRPVAMLTRTYQTDAFPSFTSILDAFAADIASEINRPLSVETAAIGVAGPVVNRQSRLTNIAWDITAAEVAVRCSTGRVRLLNDLEAIAMSVEVLIEEELLMLQPGTYRPDGNAVVVAAGIRQFRFLKGTRVCGESLQTTESRLRPHHGLARRLSSLTMPEAKA